MLQIYNCIYSDANGITLSSKAAISSEHPQVGDGELNPDAAGVTAVALTACSTQEAASSLNRREPLTLGGE